MQIHGWNLVRSPFFVYTHTCILTIIICLWITDLFQPRLCRGGPCNFPRSWLLPVLKDNVKDTELKYFFDVMLPLSASLRNKGTVPLKKLIMSRETRLSRLARALCRFSRIVLLCDDAECQCFWVYKFSYASRIEG